MTAPMGPRPPWDEAVRWAGVLALIATTPFPPAVLVLCDGEELAAARALAVRVAECGCLAHHTVLHAAGRSTLFRPPSLGAA